MNKLIFLLLTLPLISCGQQLEQKKLWKGYGVTDESGKLLNNKVEQLAYIENDLFFRLDISEMLNMETGEMTITSVIDSFSIEISTGKMTSLLSNQNKKLKIEVTSESEFRIIENGYYFPFKIIEKNEPTNFDQLNILLTNNTFFEYEKELSETKDRLLMTPLKNGNLKYSYEYSERNWESEFKVIKFKGNLIVKGITSPMLLVNSLKTDGIEFSKLDYRYDPVNIEWKTYGNNERNESVKEKVDNGFDSPNFKSADECFKSLSEEQLNQRITTTTNISKDNEAALEVQHWYDGSWFFLGDVNFDGFDQISLKEIITIDSSLCYVVNMPNGYYATREFRSDKWDIYLHEERIKTDSSMITKKAFPFDNTYNVSNELKNEKKSYFTQYYLDTKIIKEKGTWLNGKKAGIWEYYNTKGELIETENKGNNNK